MSAYDYDNFIKCFAERTFANYNRLKFSNSNFNNPDEIYDVTQLINSLFGLLIVPFEKFKNKKDKSNPQIGEDFFKTYAPSEYDSIKTLISKLENVNRLKSTYKSDEDYPVSSFIRHLRNALAHSGDMGLHFLPCNDSKSNITSIIFYDKNTEKNVHFCTELKIEEIDLLIKQISQIYQQIEKITNFYKEKDFKEIERKYRDILNGKSDQLLV